MIEDTRIFLAKWYRRLIAYFLGIFLLIFLYNIVFNIFHNFLIYWKYNFLIISLVNFLIISLPVFIIEQIRSGNFLKSLGLKFDKLTFVYFFKALGYVLVPFILIFTVAYYLKIIVPLGGTISIYILIQFLFISAFAVMQEEIFFRGVLLKYLFERYNAVGSILIVSLIFAMLHIFNPYISWSSFLSTIIAGILLSLIYLQTQSLWYAIFYHFFWNVLSALILGSPISGLSQYLFFFQLKTKNSIEQFFLGNQYGIESGILSIIILLITSFFIVKFERINPYFSSFNFKKIYNEDRILLSSKK